MTTGDNWFCNPAFEGHTPYLGGQMFRENLVTEKGMFDLRFVGVISVVSLIVFLIEL